MTGQNEHCEVELEALCEEFSPTAARLASEGVPASRIADALIAVGISIGANFYGNRKAAEVLTLFAVRIASRANNDKNYARH
jgi:hypothetical protein